MVTLNWEYQLRCMLLSSAGVYVLKNTKIIQGIDTIELYYLMKCNYIEP